MNLITRHARLHSRRLLAASSSIVILMALYIFVPTAQSQTATYSDSFAVDNFEMAYDAEEDAWIFPQDPGPPPVIVGIGVTDADYASYSESITTTLYGPGSSTSGVSYDSPSGRIEVTLSAPEDDNENDFTVQTVHRYYVDPLILAGNSNCAGGRPCTQKVGYRGSAPLNFFEVFSEAAIKTKIYRSNYAWSHYSKTPPPFIAKLCVMNKHCGYCGFSKGIAQVFSWQDCPEYIGTVWLRTWIPGWGVGHCSLIDYQVGSWFICNPY